MVTRVYEISKERRWEERIGEIQRSASKGSKEDALDKIDKEMTGVMLKREKEVAKKSKAKSTKATNKAMLKHVLLKIALSGIRNNRDFTKRLNQIARKLETQKNDPAWEDEKKTTREQRKARKDKRAVWMKAREEMRERNKKEFIENLPSNIDQEKTKKQKETIEQQKNQFRQIEQSLRKKTHGISLTSLCQNQKENTCTTQSKFKDGRKSVTPRKYKKNS
jgi:hypothetical protein